jgi:hypothetical protein
MKSIGLCPAVGSCHPNSGDPLYSLHAGFCRMVGSKTRKIPHKGPFLPNNTESESLMFTFWVPSGIAILLKVFEWGATFFVWVVSCEPHGYHTSVSIRATVSPSPTPCPALTKRVSELYPRGIFI